MIRCGWDRVVSILNRQRSLFFVCLTVFIAAIFIWVKFTTQKETENPSGVAVVQENLPPEQAPSSKQNAASPLERNTLSTESLLAPASEKQTDSNLLRVLVQSPKGKAMGGVPVSVWKLRKDQHLPWKIESTDLSGRVEFSIPPYEAGKDFSMVVGFAFPCGDARSVKLLRSDLPKGTMNLMLSSIGQVKIQLLDQEGANWRYPIKVSLVPEPTDGNHESLSRFQIGHGYGHAISNAEGVVEFPCIGDGSSVLASVLEAGFGDWESKSFQGPPGNGKVIKDLQLLSDKSMAHFRLLLPNGEPATLQAWEAEFRSFSIEGEAGSTGSTWQAHGTTDREGFGRLPLIEQVNEGEWTKRILLIEAKVSEHSAMLRAKIDILGKELTSGMDLGDVHLDPEAVLLAGHVLTEQGIPIENVTMGVREIVQVANVTRNMDFEESLANLFVPKENGAFQLRGSHPPRKMKLKISAPGFMEKEMTALTGESDLDIRLVASAVVKGQILGLSKDLLEKTLVHFIQEGSQVVGYMKMGHVVSAAPDSEGHFFLSGFEDIKIGKVAVFVNQSDEALAEVMEVTPWMISDPPDSRLQPMTVRKSNRFVVNLVDTKGDPVKNAKRRVIPAEAVNPSVNIHFAPSTNGSKFEFFDPRVEVQVFFYHPDFQVVDAIVQPGETTLVFEPPFTAKIEITNQLVLPEDFKLVVSVQSDADRGLVQDRIVIPEDIPTFLEDIPIPRAGTYRIYIELFDMTSFYDMHEVSWPNGEEFRSIEVLNQPDQVFRFTFPTEQIQEVVDAIVAERR